jgi:hypothetical protein
VRRPRRHAYADAVRSLPGEDPKTIPAPETIVPFVVDLVRPDREPPKGVVRFKDRGQESPSVDA